MNADALERRERNGSKLQPRGMFIHNVGEQADQSVTWSCYAKHTQTQKGLIQKMERREKGRAREKKKKGTDKLLRDMKELITTWGRAASQRRKHHNEHLHY